MIMRVLVFLAIFVGGCAHSRYDAAERRLCSGDTCYRMGELPGWRLLRHRGGEIAFFRSDFDAVAQANATCRDDAEVASLEVLMRHLLIGYTDVQVQQNERVRLDGREALHHVIQARLDEIGRAHV